MKVAGLMSGTSLDGLTIALISLDVPRKFSTRTLKESVREARYLSGETYPFPQKLKETLQKIANVESKEKTAFLATAHRGLGLFSADRLQQFLQSMDEKQIDLVGFHGQTVHHEPNSRKGTVTFQIGDPSPISVTTNVPVVSDYRNMDTAVGGQGAPLVPIVDYLKYGGETSRIVLNLGGISNITFIPKNAQLSGVRAFDVGPGNMLIDGAIKELLGKNFDEGGRVAQRGRLSKRLFDFILKQDNFRFLSYPKSTGRERYSDNFLGTILQRARALELSEEDIVRTISAYTIFMVDYHIRALEKRERETVEEIIVGGGGSKNAFLLENLRMLRPQAKLSFHDDYGVPARCWEAFSFAVIAYLSLHRIAGNVPSATGARRSVVLGRINYPPSLVID